MVLSLAELLAAEARAIQPGWEEGAGANAVPDSDRLERLYARLNKDGRSALCLSGGGIRSAAFSLGVIQRLAATRTGANSQSCALRDIDYLSTVSGGGYIGSWLSAWLMRARLAKTKDQLGDGSAEVLALLADTSAAAEAEAIENVRIDSNYLTPKVGALSADSWADVATYLRNLLLNWLVMAPLVTAIVLAVKLLHWGNFAVFTPGPPTSTRLIASLVAFLVMLVPLSFQIANRPTVGFKNGSQATFLGVDLLVTLAAAVMLSMSLLSGARPGGIWFFVVAGCLLYAIAWLAAVLWRSDAPSATSGTRTVPDLLKWMTAGAVFGVGLSLFWIMAPFAHLSGKAGLTPAIVAILGVPWILTSRFLAEIVFVGLTSVEVRSDEDREWFARAAGWYVAALITWLVASGLILFGAPLVTWLHHWATLKLTAIGGVSGLVTLVIGKSSVSSVSAKRNHRSLPGRLGDLAIMISTPVFACTLLIAVSASIDHVLVGTAFPQSRLFGGMAGASSPAQLLLIAAAGAIIVALGAGFFVDINQFSLHALYRDRLVRCFLAASRHTRPGRNRFTDLDEKDNPRLHQILAGPDETLWRPLHIINATLNIVSTRNLAWQERKAESFTFSALHCGSGQLGFRPTMQYGRDIKLGTAMAISGAAASPNMGYNSSSAVTFFMAIFNVRLGWWLGNPGNAGEKTANRKGPRFATKPLLIETFGLTTDEGAYVNLSDGGHFENLGLYEMVRRRCRYIVIVDAGCDPGFAFGDLGNAIRKIWLDHRVRIIMSDVGAMRPPAKTNGYALGHIHYRDADGPTAVDGVILYIKPSLNGREPVDVLAYATANQTFPHETTGDQWFSESQFESYRCLGFHQTDVAIKTVSEGAGQPFAALGAMLDHAALHRP
jgi:hypothetical protein